MKTFMGLLALGFLYLAIPHVAHADLKCEPMMRTDNVKGYFLCTTTRTYQPYYEWTSDPSGDVIPGDSQTMNPLGVLDMAYYHEMAPFLVPWVAVYKCRFLMDPPIGALPVETVRVAVALTVECS